MRSLIGALLLSLVACDAATPADTQKGKASQGAAPVAAAPKPSTGEIDRSQAGKAGLAAPFVDRAEKPFRLADFKGTPVLVNLWATWCAPCLAEMPALDRLAAREKGKLVVLPISQDLEGWRAVDKFFAPGKFKALTPYLDQPNDWALGVGAKGLPVSILYDAQGRELWRVNGPLEWDQPEVAALLPTAVTPAPADPWAAGKARGIDFRAVGNEPGWYLEMDRGREVKLVLSYGEQTLTMPAPAQWQAGRANRHQGTAKDLARPNDRTGPSVTISSTPATCNDGMSDAVYPLTVTVAVEDATFKGCGRDL